MRFAAHHTGNTPNMMRAQARKARNRHIRDQRRQEKAAALGITVQELVFREALEVNQIVANHEHRRHMAALAAAAETERWRRRW